MLCHPSCRAAMRMRAHVLSLLVVFAVVAAGHQTVQPSGLFVTNDVGAAVAPAAHPAGNRPQFVGLPGRAAKPAATTSAHACPAGQHAPALRTYILSLPRFNATRPSGAGAAGGGALLELRFALADVPAYMPLLLNRGSQGLEHGLLDTSRFLADWAALAAAGYGAMPGEVAEGTSRVRRHKQGAVPASAPVSTQCRMPALKQQALFSRILQAARLMRSAAAAPPSQAACREAKAREGAAAPSNALLALHGPRKASAVADIEGVRLEDDHVSTRDMG